MHKVCQRKPAFGERGTLTVCIQNSIVHMHSTAFAMQYSKIFAIQYRYNTVQYNIYNTLQIQYDIVHTVCKVQYLHSRTNTIKYNIKRPAVRYMEMSSFRICKTVKMQ
jgi:hypothetical protein